jgi:hypothetical protein
MTTLVRELSDGEELVVEGLIPRKPLDPRERTLAMRSRGLADDDGSVVAGPAHAPRTEGLTPLDRDRAASIADEGGASAATIETERRPKPVFLPKKERRGPDERRSSVRRGREAT